jgi:hypothetical protein
MFATFSPENLSSRLLSKNINICLYETVILWVWNFFSDMKGVNSKLAYRIYVILIANKELIKKMKGGTEYCEKYV